MRVIDTQRTKENKWKHIGWLEKIKLMSDQLERSSNNSCLNHFLFIKYFYNWLPFKFDFGMKLSLCMYYILSLSYIP